jgi:hypothetical protein
MNDKVEMPKDVAKALYQALLSPSKDSDGHTVYVVSITLATAVRMAIGDAVK